MPKFAANLTMLFTEVPFMERFSLARQAGFTYVEYLFPYEFSARELKQQLEANCLKQILFNLPSGDWANGDRGIAANPDRIAEFQAGVPKAIEYALELGVSQVNCLAGKIVAGYDNKKHMATLVENVRFAAKALQEAGLKLVVEPINHYDIPAFFLSRTEQALTLIEEAGMPNVFVQYDIYHAQREEGELAATIRKNIASIGHIQIADNPGRHEPGTGEINYSFIFKEIDALGYQGYIGLEYVPSMKGNSSFQWIKDFGYTL
ncbi:hydroxypyruvate isomerase [Anaerospora sp.]|uniref:hydroxypyruvate isomerase n=1 Tax=Anaerospora sp. TaxID=1960278 RepID=UPI00289A886C|nr:hydroxypyruvate isomerase [Anaerospora sp.]